MPGAEIYDPGRVSVVLDRAPQLVGDPRVIHEFDQLYFDKLDKVGINPAYVVRISPLSDDKTEVLLVGEMRIAVNHPFQDVMKSLNGDNRCLCAE